MSASISHTGRPAALQVHYSLSLNKPTPKSSASLYREYPLVRIICFANLRNSSVLTVPMAQLFCCTLREQRTGSELRHLLSINQSGKDSGLSLVQRSPGPGFSAGLVPPKWVITPHTALSAV